jgi:hypothetical protein
MDLRDHDCVNKAIEIVKVVRQEPMRIDITAIPMTGRCADYEADEVRWQEGDAIFTKACDSQALVHRIYYMDGRDTRQYWLRTQADLAHMAAEFVLHHGLSPYSDLARKHEGARLSQKEAPQDSCGSFCCRTLESDDFQVRNILADAIYERLCLDQPSQLANEGDVKSATEAAATFAKNLEEVFNQERKTAADATHVSRSSSLAQLLNRVERLLEASLTQVCQDAPIVKIPAFLEALHEHVQMLRARGRLFLDHEIRAAAGHALRQALKVPKHDFADVEVKVPSKRLWLGAACIVGGFLAIAGNAALSGWPILVSLAAVLFSLGFYGIYLPKAPKRYDLDRDDFEAPATSVTFRRRDVYRRFATSGERFGAAMLFGTGLLLIVFSIKPGISPSFSQTTFPAASPLALSHVPAALWVGLGIGAAVAVGLLCLAENGARISGDPAELFVRGNHTNRYYGLILGNAMVLWFVVQWPVTFREEASWRIIAACGGLLIASGTAMMAWPRVGHGEITRVRPIDMGSPNAPAPDRSSYADLANAQDRLASMCELRRKQGARTTVADWDWPIRVRCGTVLDAVDQNWPTRLAEMVKRETVYGKETDYWKKGLLLAFAGENLSVLDYRFAFAFAAACDWVNNHPWETIVKRLGGSQTGWLGKHMRQAVVPLWPHARSNWDRDVSVAAVSPDIYQYLGKDAIETESLRVVACSWPKDGTIVLLRLTQGCGYPTPSTANGSETGAHH